MTYICNDCPRQCGALRDEMTGKGYCYSPLLPKVARAAPHFGEEPCITGDRGSGAIFFTGCNLRCVFCQNHDISAGEGGKILTVDELRSTMLRLRDQGVHNINLVTPTHFTRMIAKALDGLDLGIPVVWNSSGYDSVEMLKMLDGLVQVYMPDFKYYKKSPAKLYSCAEDYPAVASAALNEMFRQRGAYKLDDDGILQSGLLIRHLILPGQELNSMDAIDYIAETFPKGSVLFSLMSQFTPMPRSDKFPELRERVSSDVNSLLIAYMQKMGIEDGYWQETESATDELIPDFDLTGLK